MNPKNTPVVVAAKRTPIGKYLGSFANTPAMTLGAVAVTGALSDAGLSPEDIDELIFDQARQAGNGPNPARQVGCAAGLPEESPAYTVNKACASGMHAVAAAADQITLGRAQAVVAGGMENMTMVPFLLPEFRLGYRLGNNKVVDAMYQDGFNCPMSEGPMGLTAEWLADEFEISRDEQDAFALHSQAKAGQAIEKNLFAQEITPVEITVKRETKTIDTDEHLRPQTTADQLAKLPPVFREDGTVHAGNASGITDGAAALVITSLAFAQEKGLTPLAQITGQATAGVSPKRMGIGPVPAMQKLFAQTQTELSNYDLLELNEAFAAQVIACDRLLPLPADKLNVNGGSIALGHPIGCTGARILVTLLYEMKRRQSKHALASLCVSGGMGMAMGFSALT